ncbi:ABC transporter substrate-binding protein [Microcoleus sp. FACHB-1515]|uniref:ABC transporter substrate-binding protein n=1 Tax=Cyanophyceae TaxID=3028117 RepID=UPI001685E063|nr:ABC transporter substrate-binding protein [Microcoleus sp. FACHB-1515]MBD2091347.1 ABC transporter substrate-binding protein [Microcoleus sp. FACHB-1515]
MLFSRRFPFLSIFRFKRWRFLAVAIAALSSILISWAVMAQQPVTLRLLMTAPDAQPWREAMVAEFEQKYPNIRIEVVEGPNATNLIEDLYTSAFLLGDSPYDLVNMDVIWTPKFAAAGWLVDLTDRVTPEQLEGFSTVDIEGGKYNDRLYRLPLRSDAGVFYYRKDLLDKHGLQPPETFDELMEQSKLLQESGDVPWGYVWQGRQYEGLAAMFVEVLEGFGGFWVNPDTLEVGLDRPETINAINWLRSTVSEGVSPPGVTTYQEEETRRFFQSGQAAFLRSWPYVWPLANADDSEIKGKIGIKPMLHAQGQESGACLGGWGLAISKSSRHQEEAWQAVQFFSSVEPQRNYILEAGYVPSRKVLFSDPQVVQKFPHYPQLLEIVGTAVLRPPIAQYAQASDILQRYLSAALTNRMSPEEAMRAAANETRTLLKT